MARLTSLRDVSRRRWPSAPASRPPTPIWCLFCNFTNTTVSSLFKTLKLAHQVSYKRGSWKDNGYEQSLDSHPDRRPGQVHSLRILLKWRSAQTNGRIAKRAGSSIAISNRAYPPYDTKTAGKWYGNSCINHIKRIQGNYYRAVNPFMPYMLPIAPASLCRANGYIGAKLGAWLRSAWLDLDLLIGA
jgi:hypothetical protein